MAGDDGVKIAFPSKKKVTQLYTASLRSASVAGRHHRGLSSLAAGAQGTTEVGEREEGRSKERILFFP